MRLDSHSNRLTKGLGEVAQLLSQGDTMFSNDFETDRIPEKFPDQVGLADATPSVNGNEFRFV